VVVDTPEWEQIQYNLIVIPIRQRKIPFSVPPDAALPVAIALQRDFGTLPAHSRPDVGSERWGRVVSLHLVTS
jgi:hypothetical protein